MGALFNIPWMPSSSSTFQEGGGAPAEWRRGHELVRALKPQTLESKYGTLTVLEWKYGTLTALEWKYRTLTPMVLEQKYGNRTQVV